MIEYLLRLALLLPLLAGLIWGSLWLTRYMQTRLAGQPGTGMRGGGRQLHLVETSLIAPGVKLAVVRFRDREILLGLSRHGMVRLSELQVDEAPAPDTAAPPESE